MGLPSRRPRGYYPFADEFHEFKTATQGVLIVGRPRVGKTVLTHGIFRAFAEDGESGSVIETASGTAELLRAVAPPGTPVNVFDVTVKDGTAMKLSAVLTSETTRKRFVQRLLRADGGGSSEFFDRWAQTALYAALFICHRFAPGRWKLGHVIQVAEDFALTTELGKLVPGLGDVYRSLGHHSDTSKDVQATVVTKLWELKTYAALADKAGREADFLEPLRKGKGWNVFKWSDRYSHVLEGLLSFSLDTIVDEALAQVTARRHVLGLDEIASYAPLTSWLGAARRGAKSGLCPIVTLHEISGLRNRYTPEVANELTALMLRKIFLSVGSPETGRWCSEYLGATEAVTDIWPVIVGEVPNSVTLTSQFGERFNFTWDQIRRQKPADPVKDRVYGIADAGEGPWQFEAPFKWVYDGVPPPVDGTPVDPKNEILVPLTDLELHEQLGFPLEAILAARAETPKKGGRREHKP